MGLKVTNNAFGTLNAGINSSATTIVLAAGQGARFPSLGAGDYFYATLIDTSNNLEIVKVTARSTDTMTVVRGQDGTTARAYSTNDRFELRPTAVMFTETIDKADAALPKAGGTMTGDLVFSSGAIRLPGSITSDAQINFKNSNSSSDTYAKFPMNTQTMFLRPNGSGQLEFWSDKSGVGRALGLNEDGRVTIPLQPYFHARNQSGYGGHSFSGESTILQFQVTDANRGNGWNSSTYRFTAPIGGIYYVYAQVRFDGLTGYSRLYISKNGGTDVWSPGIHNISPNSSSAYWSHSVSGVLYLNAGDYIEARGGANNSVGTNQGEGSFGAYFLG